MIDKGDFGHSNDLSGQQGHDRQTGWRLGRCLPNIAPFGETLIIVKPEKQCPALKRQRATSRKAERFELYAISR